MHHVPILTEGMADGSSIGYTRQALKATGYHIDPEFRDSEATSCCPPTRASDGAGQYTGTGCGALQPEGAARV